MPTQKEMIEKTCAYKPCGRIFKTRSTIKVYCCNDCAQKQLKEFRSKCPHCGKPITSMSGKTRQRPTIKNKQMEDKPTVSTQQETARPVNPPIGIQSQPVQ